jgi:transglutaminase-like putative cysteine protease
MGPHLESQNRMTPARLGPAVTALWRKSEVLLLTAAVILAVVPFGRLYADRHYLILAGGAAILAAVISLLVSPGLPWPAAAGTTLMAGYVYLALAVFHTLRPATIWDGLTQSWSTLLTASLPTLSTASYVALPVALAAAATSVAAEVALRSSWKIGPALAPLGLLVVALLFTGKRPLPPPALIMAIIGLILLTVLIRVHRRSEAGGGNFIQVSGPAGLGAAVGVPALLATAVIATGLGAVLPITPSSRRVDLRDRYHPPVQISQGITPLALLQSQLNSQSTSPLFTVRFRGVPPGEKIDRVPVAVLDTYDGAVWGTNASFAVAGHELPPGPSSDQPGPVVHQDYRIGAYGLSFLPALGRPIRTTGSHLAFDRVSGMLATSTPAPAGFTYSVDSGITDQSHVASAAVRPGTDPRFATLALPPPQGWPKAITDFASKFSAPTPYAALQLMANELRSNDFGYNKQARPGHSLGLLASFLTAPTGSSQVTTARVGFAEQFAAAFAVLARVKGFPSEVVVGYRVDPAAAARGIPIAVLPREIHAWVEVNLNGVGWVAFDPTNTVPRNSTVPPAPLPPPPPPPVPLATPGHGQGDHQALLRGTSHASGHWWPLALLIGLVLASPAAVAGIKVLRRRRRASRGPAAARVLGAWREGREALRSHGARVSPAMTVDDAARAAREALDDDTGTRVKAFEPAVNAALYAPDEPDEEMASVAWEAEASLREFLWASSTTRRRLLAAVDPRPLVGLGARGRSGIGQATRISGGPFPWPAFSKPTIRPGR